MMNDVDQLDDLLVRWQDLCERGSPPAAEEVCVEYPELVSAFDNRLQAMQRLARHLGIGVFGVGQEQSQSDTPATAKSCANASLQAAANLAHVRLPANAASLLFLDPSEEPDCLGRLANYRVLSVLAEGGMGLLLKAEESQPRRLVAIKIMRPELATAVMRRRFLREGQALASVEHERVVPVFRVDEFHGVPFLVMPLLQGESLYVRLLKGRPSVAEVLRIGREIAEGLAAHAAGVMHRDIKPLNIWLRGSEGRVVLLDFGLARPLEQDAADGAELTSAGAILGTVGYLAPEQACGKPVDARADLFGLGCVLYELTTGVRPFSGPDKLAALCALASDHPQRPKDVRADVPAALSALIMRLLAKSPDERPTSAAEVVAALRAIEDQHGALGSTDDIPAPSGADAAPLKSVSFDIAPVRRSEMAERPPYPRRHKLWLYTSAGIAVVAMSLVAWQWSVRHNHLIAPLRVLSIDVQHVARLSENHGYAKGTLGKTSFAPHLGDQATIESKLSRPAYAYLLAFRPDGELDLCFPQSDLEPPPLTDELAYPLPSHSNDIRYGLSEGAGLWVFAVLASEQPLPAYREFVAQHEPKWSPAAMPLTGNGPATVWWFDGERLQPLTEPSTTNNTRGKGEKAVTIARDAVAGVADWLKRSSDGGAIGAIGFEVRP
jgi:serine/threonine protein kinase